MSQLGSSSACSCSVAPRWPLSIHCSAQSSDSNGRVLILGATGRVGGSTTRALSKSCPNLKLVVAGRDRDKGEQLLMELGKEAEFIQFDIDNATALRAAMDGVDLVVHTAGPFQRREQCNVLEAAILSKSWLLNWYALLALEQALVQDLSLIVCAGSGGAGPTILATSFLLLGEEVVAFRKGEKILQKPYSGQLDVDFGKGVGRRAVYLLNLPEVASAYEVLGVPSVSARFGTAPTIWNWAMSAVANLAPAGFLSDRANVEELVKLSFPLVRALDGVVGELMSMRVDLECIDGRKSVGLYSHKKLSVCVGVAIAAFARAILEGSTQPGVWFPEEPEGIAVEARQQLLERAAEGTLNFVMNRSPWMIEKDPKELGFGIYIQ